jgi:peptidoglycan-associated lipoprotein
MVYRRGQFLVILSVLVLALFPVACAKRPATVMTTAAAPAPGALSTLSAPPPPAVAPAAPASPEPVAAATETPAPTTPAEATPPPLPREFAAIDALKDIHFNFDRYDIRPGDAEILNANAGWMKENSDYVILIEGHCDERGTNDYNLALGERRAKATVSHLVAQGVQADRMTLISYGKERPLCTEKNEQCWVQNRRTHFLVKGR